MLRYGVQPWRMGRVLAWPHSAVKSRGIVATSAVLDARAHVRALRAGFAARDVEQVWEAWDALRACNALGQLRTHDHADTLALVRASLAHISPGALRRQPAWRERCSAWGMHAAERMDVLGVQGWMKVELMCGDARNAIRLFQAYLDARRAARVDAHDAVHLLDAGQRRQPVHDMLELLILAYADVDDLHGLVHTLESFDVGKHTELFFDLAHCHRQYTKMPWVKACMNPDVCERAYAWVSHAELARGLLQGSGGYAGPNRIARLLGSVFARGDVPSAWRLYRTAMEAGVAPANTSTTCAWLSQDGLACGDQIGAWTDSAWALCFSGFLAANRADMAAQVWHDMLTVRARMEGSAWPPLSMWNAILDGYSRSGDYSAVELTWRVLTHQLPVHHLPLANASAQSLTPPSDGPDLMCYTTMIAALFRARHVDAARQLFSELQAKQARGELIVPVETYNAVLHGLCAAGRMDDAYALLQTMGRDNVPSPTITTINSLLRAQARQKHLPAMAETLRLIMPLGLRPDVITFTTVLDALLRTASSPESAERAVDQVMQIMQSLDVQPNSITFTAMIKACLHSKGDTPPRVFVALQLMHTMFTNVKLAPTPITFETLVQGIQQYARYIDASTQSLPPAFTRGLSPWPDERSAPHMRPQSVHILATLWDMMLQRQVTPTTDTYHILVRALLGPGTDKAAFRRGVCIADALLQMRGALFAYVHAPPDLHVMEPASPPFSASWSAVLYALVRRGKSQDDENMYRQVLAAILRHFESSPHGEKALKTSSKYASTRLPRLVEQAQHSLA